jgi:hypothetical protein
MANWELPNLFSLRALRSLRLLILFFTAEIAEHAENENVFLKLLIIIDLRLSSLFSENALTNKDDFRLLFRGDERVRAWIFGKNL